MTSKTRVAPLKRLSTPCLELKAVWILATLSDTVKGALINQLDISDTVLWFDIMTALIWINNKGEWKQFVKHRVEEILKTTTSDQWRYCPTHDNPSDVGTRGTDPVKFDNSELWRKGPS